MQNLHQTEVNKVNKFGTRGDLSKNFGKVCALTDAQVSQAIWSSSPLHRPLLFRKAVVAAAPQFAGFRQHDSQVRWPDPQELLSVVIDLLHEDLSRVVDRPYIENPDSEGRTDEELAALYEEAFKKRNQSVIVDLFQGLLKSRSAPSLSRRVQCTVCPHASTTFDPLTFVSLPLPVETLRHLEVTVRRQVASSLATN